MEQVVSQHLNFLIEDTKVRFKRCSDDIYNIGVNLLEIRDLAPHGQFLALIAETGLGQSTAYKAMNAAKRVQEVLKNKLPENGSLNVAPSALYFLAESSTPADVLAEALDRATLGEFITQDKAQQMVVAHQGLSPHQLLHSSESNEWYTPKAYIDAAKHVMGHIDLDPASNGKANETVQAQQYFTKEDDGFAQQWFGRVWLNPPYGKTKGKSNQMLWSKKLMDEYHSGRVNEALLLVNNSTDASWFEPLWDYPICFVEKRIPFDNGDGLKGAPTKGNAIIYFGRNTERFIDRFRWFGRTFEAAAAKPIDVTALIASLESVPGTHDTVIANTGTIQPVITSPTRILKVAHPTFKAEGDCKSNEINELAGAVKKSYNCDEISRLIIELKEHVDSRVRLGSCIVMALRKQMAHLSRPPSYSSNAR